MIKKDITFEDFDGNMVTETHWFHLSKAKLIDWMMEADGDLAAQLQAISDGNDGGQIMAAFKDILGRAYGQRDPVRNTVFVQSQKISDDFLNSMAFDKLLEDLLTDPVFAAQFVNGIVPKDLSGNPEFQEAIAKAAPDLPRQAPRTIETVDLTRGSVGVHVGIGNPDLPDVPPLPRDDQSGLKDPRDNRGQLLPWAFRRPTDAELTAMTKHQLLDASRRQMSSTWSPPDSSTANPS